MTVKEITVGAIVLGGAWFSLQLIERLLAANPQQAILWILAKFLAVIVVAFFGIFFIMNASKPPSKIIQRTEIPAPPTQKPTVDRYALKSEQEAMVHKLEYLQKRGLIDVKAKPIGKASFTILDGLEIQAEATAKVENVDLSQLLKVVKAPSRPYVEGGVEG